MARRLVGSAVALTPAVALELGLTSASASSSGPSPQGEIVRYPRLQPKTAVVTASASSTGWIAARVAALASAAIVLPLLMRRGRREIETG